MNMKLFYSFLVAAVVALECSGLSASQLKQEIRSLSLGTNNGLSASSAVSAAINDKVANLKSPQRNMATSTSLNGRWRLVFTSTTGASAGKLGPFVGEVFQIIDVIFRTTVTHTSQ